MNDERGCGLSNKDTRANEGVVLHVNITVSTIAAVALWQHKDVNPMVMVVLCDEFVDKVCVLCGLFMCWQKIRFNQNRVRSDTNSEKIDTPNPRRITSESVSFFSIDFVLHLLLALLALLWYDSLSTK